MENKTDINLLSYVPITCKNCGKNFYTKIKDRKHCRTCLDKRPNETK